MARGINKVTLIGNLGSDPDIRYTASGTPVATVSVATSESWNDKRTGEREERTEWHRCVMFGKLAEVAGNFLSKGAQVYLEGSLRTNKWQDGKGIERFTTEIVVRDMQMLGGRASTGGAHTEARTEHKQAVGSDVAVGGDVGVGGTDIGDMDDIPF